MVMIAYEHAATTSAYDFRSRSGTSGISAPAVGGSVGVGITDVRCQGPGPPPPQPKPLAVIGYPPGTLDPPRTPPTPLAQGSDPTKANFRIRRSGTYSKYKKTKKKFFVLLEHCDLPYDLSRLQYYDVPAKRWLSIVNRFTHISRGADKLSSPSHHQITATQILSQSHPEISPEANFGKTLATPARGSFTLGGVHHTTSRLKQQDASWYLDNLKPKRTIYLKDCFNIDRVRWPGPALGSTTIQAPSPTTAAKNSLMGGSSGGSKRSSLPFIDIHQTNEAEAKKRAYSNSATLKFAIATQAQDPFNCVTFLLDTADEMGAWLEDLWILHQLSKKGLLTFPLLPTYEYVWQINVRTQGINSEYRLFGSYFICLNSEENIFTFYKYRNYYDNSQYEDDYYFQQNCKGSTEHNGEEDSKSTSTVQHQHLPKKWSPSRKDVQIAYIELCSIKRCGHANNFFYIELGRTSSLGPGEIWMHLAEYAQAQQLHSIILERMKCRFKGSFPVPSSSSGTSLSTTNEQSPSDSAPSSSLTPVNSMSNGSRVTKLLPLVLSPIGVSPDPHSTAMIPNPPSNSSSSSGTLTYLPIAPTNNAGPKVTLPDPNDFDLSAGNAKNAINGNADPSSQRVSTNNQGRFPIRAPTSYVEMSYGDGELDRFYGEEWPVTFFKEDDLRQQTQHKEHVGAENISFNRGPDAVIDPKLEPLSQDQNTSAYTIMSKSSQDIFGEGKHFLNSPPKSCYGAGGGGESSNSDRSRLGSDASAISSTYSYNPDNPPGSDNYIASSSSPETHKKISAKVKDEVFSKMSLRERLQYLKQQCANGGSLGNGIRPDARSNQHPQYNSEAIFASHDSGYMDMVTSFNTSEPASHLLTNSPSQDHHAISNAPYTGMGYMEMNGLPPREVNSVGSNQRISIMGGTFPFNDLSSLESSNVSNASLSSLPTSPFPSSAPAKSCFLADTLEIDFDKSHSHTPSHHGNPSKHAMQVSNGCGLSSTSIEELSSKIEKVPGLYFSEPQDNNSDTSSIRSSTTDSKNLAPCTFLRASSFSCANVDANTSDHKQTLSTSSINKQHLKNRFTCLNANGRGESTANSDSLIDKMPNKLAYEFPHPRYNSSELVTTKSRTLPTPVSIGRRPPSPPPFPNFFFAQSPSPNTDRTIDRTPVAKPTKNSVVYQSHHEDDYQTLADRVRAYSLGSRPIPPFVSLRNRKKSSKVEKGDKPPPTSVQARRIPSAKKHHPIPPRFPIIEGLVFDSPTSPSLSSSTGNTITHTVLIEESPNLATDDN